MKSNTLCRLITAIVLSVATLAATAGTAREIDNPVVDKTNTAQIFIDAVNLSPDSTTITFRTYSYLNGSIKIQEGAYLQSDGKKYAMRNVSGIQLGKRIKMSALSDTVFSVSFEPLPTDTKTFDFIEGDKDGYFRLEGIHTDKSFNGQTPIYQIDVLPKPEWKKGTAVLKGKILNYKPEEGKTSATVYPRSALGRYIDKTIGSAPIDSTGSFTISIPLYQTYQPCFFDAPGLYGLIYLSPGTESSVTIDMAQRASHRHSGKDGSVIFTGANSELNNQLTLNIGHDMIWDSFHNNKQRDKSYATSDELTADILKSGHARREKISRLPFTPSMKQLMNIIITNDEIMSRLDTSSLRELTDFGLSYYDFFKVIDITDPMLMWAENYDSMTGQLSQISPYMLSIYVGSRPSAFYRYLIDNNMLSDKEKDLVESLMKYDLEGLPKSVVDEYAIKTAARVKHYCDSLGLEGTEETRASLLTRLLESGELDNYYDVGSHYLSWLLNLNYNGHTIELKQVPFENKAIRESNRFHEKKEADIKAFSEKFNKEYTLWRMNYDIDKSIDNFRKLTGAESEIIEQLIAVKRYMSHIESRNILNGAQLEECSKRVPQMFYDFIVEQNNSMAETLRRSQMNILDTDPESSGDEVLRQIAEKYKGKVIYIDIWATWCGPCLHAISEIQPIKKDYTDKVTFVYLADELSPLDIWNEKIESIEGEHLRLKQKQMDEIMTKFGFAGYPSYIVIGKDGSVAFSGHIHGNDSIKKLLDKEIAK